MSVLVMVCQQGLYINVMVNVVIHALIHHHHLYVLQPHVLPADITLSPIPFVYCAAAPVPQQRQPSSNNKRCAPYCSVDDLPLSIERVSSLYHELIELRTQVFYILRAGRLPCIVA